MNERAKKRKNDEPKKKNGEMILYANRRRTIGVCADCSGKSVIS